MKADCDFRYSYAGFTFQWDKGLWRDIQNKNVTMTSAKMDSVVSQGKAFRVFGETV